MASSNTSFLFLDIYESKFSSECVIFRYKQKVSLSNFIYIDKSKVISGLYKKKSSRLLEVQKHLNLPAF